MIFQNCTLCPNVAVYDNMAFGLKLRIRKISQIDRVVKETARILNLKYLVKRKSKELSSTQRVVVGRAIYPGS